MAQELRVVKGPPHFPHLLFWGGTFLRSYSAGLLPCSDLAQVWITPYVRNDLFSVSSLMTDTKLLLAGFEWLWIKNPLWQSFPFVSSPSLLEGELPQPGLDGSTARLQLVVENSTLPPPSSASPSNAHLLLLISPGLILSYLINFYLIPSVLFLCISCLLSSGGEIQHRHNIQIIAFRTVWHHRIVA